MRIYGTIAVKYFAYLLIIMYDYIVVHLNFHKIMHKLDLFTPITLQLLHAASMFSQHFHDF